AVDAVGAGSTRTALDTASTVRAGASCEERGRENHTAPHTITRNATAKVRRLRGGGRESTAFMPRNVAQGPEAEPAAGNSEVPVRRRRVADPWEQWGGCRGHDEGSLPP